MRRGALLSLFIAIGVAVSTPGAELRRNRDVSERAMAEFHRQFVDKQFELIYAGADPALRAAAPKAELLASMAGVRQRYGRWLRSEIRQASCFADGKVKFFCDAWYESGDVTEIFVWQVTGSKAALVLYRPSPGRQPAPGDHPTLSPPCPK
jgi:hypothetical protein